MKHLITWGRTLRHQNYLFRFLSDYDKELLIESLYDKVKELTDTIEKLQEENRKCQKKESQCTQTTTTLNA